MLSYANCNSLNSVRKTVIILISRLILLFQERKMKNESCRQDCGGSNNFLTFQWANSSFLNLHQASSRRKT